LSHKRLRDASPILCLLFKKNQSRSADGKSPGSFKKIRHRALTENLTGRFKNYETQSADGKISPAVSKKIRVGAPTENLTGSFKKKQTQSADGKISPAVSKIMRRRALTEKSHRQIQKL
jgi:hypothetical protein